MNLLDIILIVSLALGFLLGWKLRAIHLTGMALSLIAGILIANHYYPQLLGSFRQFPLPVSRILSWLVLFLVTAVTISILGGLLSKAFEVIRLKWLDHLLGAALGIGFILGLLIIGLTALEHLSRIYRWQIVQRSTLSAPLLQATRPLTRQCLTAFPKLRRALK